MKIFYSPIKDYPKAIVNVIKQKPVLSSIAIISFVSAATFLCLAASFCFLPMSPLLFMAIALPSSAVGISLFGVSGVTLPFLYGKYKRNLYTLYRKNHSEFKSERKRVLLVLRAKEDHNKISKFDRRKFYASIEKNYTIIFKTVATVEEMRQAVKEVGKQKKISRLMIEAHGAPEGFVLSKKEVVTTYSKTLEALSKEIQKRLTQNATIILNSCSTGGNALSENIAQKIASRTGKTVYAPTDDINYQGIKVDRMNPLSCKFVRVKKPTSSFPPIKIAQKVRYCFYLLFNFGYEDVTFKAQSSLS